MSRTRDGAGTERMAEDPTNGRSPRTNLGLPKKEAEKQPGVDPQLTFGIFHSEDSRPSEFGRGFMAKAFCRIGYSLALVAPLGGPARAQAVTGMTADRPGRPPRAKKRSNSVTNRGVWRR